MEQRQLSVFQRDPAARFTLGLIGALQVTVAAAAMATSTTLDAVGFELLVVGGVGLAYIALAVSGRLFFQGSPQSVNENSSESRGRATRHPSDWRCD
jgi:hypothetical protein